MMFDSSQIARATRGTAIAAGGPGPLLTDTRRLQREAWFVALVGDTFDGHAFLPHALSAGCAGAVVSDRSKVPDGWSAGLVVVPDTLVALQDLARAARHAISVPVVGITGSAGKTTTRVMISEVLRAIPLDADAPPRRVHHTQGNLNNHIGLPLTLCATPPDAEFVVLELGMSHLHEIELLAEISMPDVRVITNVGAAHVEGCGSIANVALAKQEIFDSARFGDACIVNDDDPRIAGMPIPFGARKIRFGRGEECEVRLTDVSVDVDRLQTRVRIETPAGTVRAVLDVPGLHLAECALAAVAVGFALRVPVETMGPALGRFKPEGMRNRIERVHGVVVIDDAYNANPVSMAAALRTLAALPNAKVAVLGDMLELGPAEAESHRDVLRLGLSLGLTLLVTGARMHAAAATLEHRGGKGTLHLYRDADALGDALCEPPQRLETIGFMPLRRGDALLVKGSRGSRMERVLDRWRGAGAGVVGAPADDAITEENAR